MDEDKYPCQSRGFLHYIALVATEGGIFSVFIASATALGGCVVIALLRYWTTDASTFWTYVGEVTNAYYIYDFLALIGWAIFCAIIWFVWSGYKRDKEQHKAREQEAKMRAEAEEREADAKKQLTDKAKAKADQEAEKAAKTERLRQIIHYIDELRDSTKFSSIDQMANQSSWNDIKVPEFRKQIREFMHETVGRLDSIDKSFTQNVGLVPPDWNDNNKSSQGRMTAAKKWNQFKQKLSTIHEKAMRTLDEI